MVVAAAVTDRTINSALAAAAADSSVGAAQQLMTLYISRL